jgi:hypothetical protein
MATWEQLTLEQKIRLLMEQDGLDRARAERQVAIYDGRLDPSDVVGLPPAKPLGVK